MPMRLTGTGRQPSKGQAKGSVNGIVLISTSAPIQEMRQVRFCSHMQSRCYPGECHCRFVTEPFRDRQLPRISFAAVDQALRVPFALGQLDFDDSFGLGVRGFLDGFSVMTGACLLAQLLK